MVVASLDTGPAAEVIGLTKAYGHQRAVDELSFAVERGRVTGFLGPNGAGKTTTLRMLLGLATPTAGDAFVLGRRYGELDAPARAVGALIDASGFHPGRRVRHELSIQAAAAGIDDRRIDVVLGEVGLADADGKRVAQLSLGMRQRLGLAAALLGDPALLVLDEPANGLDPAGIHWLRELLRGCAARGTAVLVSSHLLSELALFADDVVVVNHGRLVVQSPVGDLVAGGSQHVFVAAPDLEHLAALIAAEGGTVTPTDGGAVVRDVDAPTIGELAAAHRVVLHELRTERQSLEEVFLDLTGDGAGIR
jgi:ABC-2 type transport system ATP-binding protein